MAKKKPYEDKHLLPQFGLRMPQDLREALEAQVSIYNRTRETGQPPRSLSTEIIARLYSTLGVETGAAKVSAAKAKPKAKAVARG